MDDRVRVSFQRHGMRPDDVLTLSLSGYGEVEDFDGETDVLHEHSHHGCEEEPGEGLELWSPEGLATDCALA